MEETREQTSSVVHRILGGAEPEPRPGVTLVDFDPEGEDKVLAAICYPHADLPEDEIVERVRRLGADDRRQLLAAYVGERSNRRHKPGRALERTDYRFDVLADYGAFRDLQRHRMLTIEWQQLSPQHGYDLPDAVVEAGVEREFSDAMDRSAALHGAMALRFPEQASYAVALAYRIRFAMQFNAREAFHMLELRSGPQGHPAYRTVAQEMHRLIGEQAGHHAIAAAMRHVDHGVYELERLEAERAAAARRAARS